MVRCTVCDRRRWSVCARLLGWDKIDHARVVETSIGRIPIETTVRWVCRKCQSPHPEVLTDSEQREIADLVSTLSRLQPGTDSAGTNSLDVGLKLAQLVERKSQTVDYLRNELLTYARCFWHSESLPKLLRCMDGYLSEYSDRKMIGPLIGLMDSAWEADDREVAGRCALLLAKTGLSSKAQSAYAWACAKGLVVSLRV